MCFMVLCLNNFSYGANLTKLTDTLYFPSIPFNIYEPTTHKKLLDNKIISYCTFLWSKPYCFDHTDEQRDVILQNDYNCFLDKITASTF